MAKHIIIEGIDGTGKDTQLQMLYHVVPTAGYRPYFLRTPTGGDEGGIPQGAVTEYGAVLRKAWADISSYGINHDVAHLLTSPIFLADMIDLDRRVWGTNTPGGGALQYPNEAEFQEEPKYAQRCKDKIDRTFVIQSRSWASTYAYQFNSPEVQALALAASKKLKPPDLWIWLDHDVSVTMKRIESRAAGATGNAKSQQSLYEKGDRLLHTQKAFADLFANKWQPAYGPWVRIQADQEPERVHLSIMAELRGRGIL
jgi:thymidylate kinase